jgi:hypothetical protein
MRKVFTILSCLALSFLLFPSQMKADEVTDYTYLLKNPSFELTTGDVPLPVPVVTERFLPYGWNHTVIYNGNSIPWSATENNSTTANGVVQTVKALVK